MRTKAVVMSGLLLLSTISFSQTERGNYIISGRTSLELSRASSHMSNNGTSIPEGEVDLNSFKLTSGFGYFTTDNLALGFSFQYSHSGEDYKSNELTFMPTLMYFIPSGSPLRLYGQIGAGVAYASEKSGSYREFFSGFAYGGGIGLAYFITNNVAVDLGLQLVGTKLSYSEDDNIKIKGASLGSAIGFTLVF